jgi:hypothetical protein
MTPHPSIQTCIAEAQRARAQALHYAALAQRSTPMSDLAVAQRRRHWLHALRWRADAILWDRAAHKAQRMRMPPPEDDEGYDRALDEAGTRNDRERDLDDAG